MGSKRLDSITDYIREGVNLRVECWCKHVTILSAQQMMKDCLERNLPTAVPQIEVRLRCSKCRRRGHARIGPIG